MNGDLVKAYKAIEDHLDAAVERIGSACSIASGIDDRISYYGLDDLRQAIEDYRRSIGEYRWMLEHEEGEL